MIYITNSIPGLGSQLRATIIDIVISNNNQKLYFTNPNMKHEGYALKLGNTALVSSRFALEVSFQYEQLTICLCKIYDRSLN